MKKNYGKPNRKRPILKPIYFSEEENEKIEMAMQRTGMNRGELIRFRVLNVIWDHQNGITHI